jgi:hypothetical protein
MSEKKRARQRALPKAAQVTTRDCRFFVAADSAALVSIVGRLRISADDLADKLNDLATRFFEYYALQNAPTTPSRAAEWCNALAIDADHLLQTLALPDQGYPARKLPLQTRALLTGAAGFEVVFQPHQLYALGIPVDAKLRPERSNTIYRALDEVAPALWALKQAAQNAAAGYRARASVNAERGEQ